MSFLRILVIAVLLLNLGLTLSADIFSQDDHTHAQQVSSMSTENCFDPCHAGASHFGHCSVVFKSLPADAFAPSNDQVLGSRTESMIEEPFLEGHRRPPKLA